MKLAVISHTEHYKTTDGTIVGWGPTVTELNNLLNVFDKIYHIAMLHQCEAPPSALPYKSQNIVFVSLPPLGGKSIYDKLKIIYNASRVLSTLNKTLTKVDYFQFRAPTGIGVYIIPYLMYCVKKKGWFKYAGNWGQINPPLGYKIQRWLLSNQSRKVTINGMWPNQPNHCLSFENPCLTINELKEGIQIRQEKRYDQKINFCYVGRLEKPKGVELLIKAFSCLDQEMKSKVGVLHLVGNGPNISEFKALAEKSEVTILFHGYLPRKKVFEIYKESHVFVMPTTASEGFPKVIAEAMNYGCLPIVSNISSIGHYIINKQNGLLIEEINHENLALKVSSVLNYNKEYFLALTRNYNGLVEKFTFDYYNLRIKEELV